MDEFIIKCKELENKIELNYNFNKVGIVPICIYNSPESSKDGLACLILGKERYKKEKEDIKLKFIMEEIERKEDIRSIFESLYDLFFKTFGRNITYEDLQKCLVDVIYQPKNKNVNILFVCHITGVSRRLESDKYKNIEYIPIEEIQIRSSEICKSVRQISYHLIPLYNRLDVHSFISF